jgi:hypothetical protein
MAYIPNATDATQPTDNVDASTAAAEFRTLKGYIQALVLAAGMFSTVRQTVTDGFVNATGDPAFMIAAAAGGQALDLKATGRPIVVNFAGGSSGTGVNDRNSTLTADTANVITALPASNTSFIYADYVNAAGWTWGQTLIPPQYEKVYDRTRQALLRFAGADASTTILDDYGNTWTANGNAQIDTAVQIDGLNTLLLDGAGDTVSCPNFTNIGLDSWTLEEKIRYNALPAPGASMTAFEACNAGSFGCILYLENVAGTIKLKLSLSSTGAANDIAAAVIGTSAVWATGTTYHLAVTFDALAGKYLVYKDGVLDITVVSPSRVCVLTKMLIGDNNIGTSFLNGAVAGFRFSPCCRYPNGTAFAVPNISTFAAEGDFFDIQAMKMYSITGPSTAAGSPPANVQKYRCYLGEVDTGLAAPATIRNYAFNGTAEISVVGLTPVINTINHNLGTIPKRTRFVIVNKILDNICNPGNEAESSAQINPVANAGYTLVSSRNRTILLISNVAYIVIIVSGASSNIVYANYNTKLYVSRGWGGAN